MRRNLLTCSLPRGTTVVDCAGVCVGTAQLDCSGVCGGTCPNAYYASVDTSSPGTLRGTLQALIKDHLSDP